MYYSFKCKESKKKLLKNWMISYKTAPWSSNSVEEKNTSSSSSGTDGTSPPNSMVVMLKTNPLIDECPGAKQLPPSNKPILLHGGGAFQSFSNTAMATVSILLITLFLSSLSRKKIFESSVKNWPEKYDLNLT